MVRFILEAEVYVYHLVWEDNSIGPENKNRGIIQNMTPQFISGKLNFFPPNYIFPLELVKFFRFIQKIPWLAVIFNCNCNCCMSKRKMDRTNTVNVLKDSGTVHN